MLISQPGSDYQLTQITLDAGRTRDITCLLLDIHAVLDQLHLDGTRPEITATADAILRESGSPYTLPGLISALDEVISQLTRATRHAIADITRPAATTGQALTRRVPGDRYAAPAG
jgi:hypothetical protein